jgi:phosphopantetheine adenylyltransferase
MERQMTIREVTIKLDYEQVDKIVLERLKEDYKQLKSIRDRFGTAYENDFFEAIKHMIRYYMIESEYKDWVKEQL